MIRKTFAVFAAAGIASVAGAQELPVLLIVDITDPSNVVFVATGNAAAVNDSSASIVGGMSLIGLFGGSGFTTGSVPIGGDLSPSGNTGAYNRILNSIGTLGNTGLNFWATGVGGGQSFNTTDPAFSGSTSGFDFGGATFNASGNIVIGDTAGIPGSGAVLGTWQLVPSPSVLALAPVGLLLASRRRRG